MKNIQARRKDKILLRQKRYYLNSVPHLNYFGICMWKNYTQNIRSILYRYKWNTSKLNKNYIFFQFLKFSYEKSEYGVFFF